MKWIFAFCLCFVLNAQSQACWAICGRCEPVLFERCIPCVPQYQPYCQPLFIYPNKDKEEGEDYPPYCDVNGVVSNVGYSGGGEFTLSGDGLNNNSDFGNGFGNGYGSGRSIHDYFDKCLPVYCPPNNCNVICPPADCYPPPVNPPPVNPPTTPVPAPMGLFLFVIGFSFLLVYRRF